MSEAPIARRVLERMRRQVHSKIVDLAAFKEGNQFAEALQNSVVTPERRSRECTRPTRFIRTSRTRCP
jgi:hypothetical protein